MIKWKTKKFRKAIVLTIALLLIGGMVLSACFGFFDFLTGKKEAQGTPGSKVAIVNGEEIDREYFEAKYKQAREYYLMQGIDLESKKETDLLKQVQQEILQQMINNILLLQQAEAEGITPDQKEIQSRYDEFLANYEDEETLKKLLSNSNLTLDDLRQEIAEVLAIEKYVDRYIEENIDEKELAVSDEEMKAFYEQYSLQREEPPAYEEIKQELQETLKRQKLQHHLALLLQKLHQKSEIQILL